MLSYISGTFTAENYIHSITFKLKFSKWKIGKQDSAWVETCNLPFKYKKVWKIILLQTDGQWKGHRTIFMKVCVVASHAGI